MNLIQLDQNIFSWFNSLAQRNIIIDDIVKVIAVYTVCLVPIIMFFFFWWRSNEGRQKFLINLFGSSFLISLMIIAPLIGKLINRPRPFDFVGTKELVFHLPSYSFPSDHSLFFAFATTYLFLFGYKKWAWITLAVTILVSIARIIAGLHWPGDIIAGWIMGVILAYLFYFIRKPLEKYIINPVYGFLKKTKII